MLRDVQSSIIAPIAQHYVEHMPSDSIAFKESKQSEQDTLARINKMKMNAMMQGIVINFSPMNYLNSSLFEAPPPRNEISKLPKVKLQKLKLLDYNV